MPRDEFPPAEPDLNGGCSVKIRLAGALLVCFAINAQADVVARFQKRLETHLPAAAAKRAVRFSAGEADSLVALHGDEKKLGGLRIGYPRTYSAPFAVEHGSQRVTVQAIGARAAEVRTDGGRLFYEDAYPGVDALQLPDSSRSEEILLLRAKGAPLVYEYAVSDLRGVAGVVPDDGGIRFEVEDTASASGAALRIERPWVIDATGRRSESAARWEIANSGNITLRLVVDDEGLEYPLLVDPTFASAGTLERPRRVHTAAALHDGGVLIVGGFNASYVPEAELFDAAGGFRVTDSLNVPRIRPTATVLRDGRVLVAGGGVTGSFTGTNVAELYDPEAGTFTITDAMGDARTGHVATLLADGRVLVVGGRDETDAPVATAEIYDPASGQFSFTGEMAVGRVEPGIATLPDGRVLIVGGSNANVAGGPYLLSAEIYDPATGTFGSGGLMATARSRPVTMLLPTGRVLVYGGWANGNVFTSELYDPATGTFSSTGSTSIEHATAGLFPDGKVLVMGDGPGNPSGPGYGELYDPAAGSFSYPLALPFSSRAGATATMLPGGDLLLVSGDDEDSVHSAELFIAESPAALAVGPTGVARELHTSTLLPDGRVLIAGGRNGDGTHGSAEIFDPATEDFTPAGSMSVGRYGHAATLLRDGRVLVTGGGSTTTEIYDPATNSWSTTGALSPARRYHTATLLADGRVLITGGTYDFGPMTRADVWDPATGVFTMTDTMDVTRSNHGAVLLHDGRVLVAGGSTSPTDLVETWDPSTALFTPAGTDLYTRQGARVVLLRDGRVDISGGNAVNGGSVTFDPETGEFTDGYIHSAVPTSHTATVLSDDTFLLAGGLSPASQTAWRHRGSRNAIMNRTAENLVVPRQNHRATLLKDGRVLVTGGLSGDSVTNLAEVYVANDNVQESRRPVITSLTPVVCQPASLHALGTNFSSMMTGASGRTSGSEANLPLLRLQRVEGDRTFYARPSSRNATSFDSTTISGLPLGHYRATVISNGISSIEQVIEVSTNAAPVIGDYGNATLVQAQDTTVTPSSVPVAGTFTTLTVTASSGFLGTLSIDGTSGVVSIDDARPAGTYTITISASTSCATTQETFTLTVQPLAAPVVSATAVSTSMISVSWNAVNGASLYEVFQKQGAGDYVSLGTSSGTDQTLTGLLPDTAYLYRVRAVDPLGGIGPLSSPELATTTMLTAIASGTPTVIQAAHLQQLRTAANAVRAAAGGAPYSFTDPSLAGVVVKAVHFEELRTILETARTQLSLPDFAGSGILPAAGLMVRGLDVTRLQNGVK
jgi:hypothetical protein